MIYIDIPRRWTSAGMCCGQYYMTRTFFNNSILDTNCEIRFNCEKSKVFKFLT